MGMFDYIKCEHPLPGLTDPAAINFQTTAFDCLMDKYRITADGRLLKERYHVEDRSDPNATGLARLFGCATSVHEAWDDINYHGVLRFYGNAHEFHAKFTDGKLVNVERTT